MREVRLGKTWRLGKQVGGGGFGQVYEADAAGVAAAAKFVPKAPGADRSCCSPNLPTPGTWCQSSTVVKPRTRGCW